MSKGFDKNYWEKNYSDLTEMDGIANASEHARYAKAFFDVEFVEVKSIVDLGFGLGEMLKAFHTEFHPYRAMGVEPSQHAYEHVISQKWPTNRDISLFNLSLQQWAQSKKKVFKSFDLGLCTSVFQYLKDEEIAEILPIMSQRIRYLYFSVPTSRELQRQRSELDFDDEYAIRRSKKSYQSLLAPHFTFVSSRILESKYFFDSASTHLTDLLFRF